MAITRKAPLSGAPRRSGAGGLALGAGGLAIGASFIPQIINTSGQVAQTAIVADASKKGLDAINKVLDNPYALPVLGVVALALLLR